jgi:gamma-glutamylputrescine oxidase
MKDQHTALPEGYLDTLYTRTLADDTLYPALTGSVEADVCIIGGGIAGISAAWALTSRGLSVVLVEARRIAWGASGRNGGMLTSGFAASSGSILARSGAKDARALHDLSAEGVQIVLQNTRALGLKGVNPVNGVIIASRYPDTPGMTAWQAEAKEQFGQELHYLPTEKLRELVKTERFHDAVYDPNGYHIHPLNYCRGLAAEICRAGGQIYEQTTMVSMDLNGAHKTITTEAGQVTARYVVLCGSGYSGPAFGALRRALLPISTYVISTRGLGERAREIMATPAAVADTRLSCDYFRITPEGEMLWGGGMSALKKEPANLAAMMRARMLDVFPQLADVEVQLAWSGKMGYARHKMPYLVEMQPEVWTATALGGHGLNTGPILGRVLAEAITKESQRYRLFRPYGLRWNGSIAGPWVANGICAASNLMNRLRERC